MKDVYKLASPMLIILGIFLIFGIKVTVGVTTIVLGIILWIEESNNKH